MAGIAPPPPGFEIVGSDVPDPPAGFEIQKPMAAPADYGIDFGQPVEKVRAAVARLPAEQRQGAIKAWAQDYVAREHKSSPTMMAMADKFRQFVRGFPVGSWMDEFSAGANHALFGTPTDEGLAYQRERDRYADENSSVIGRLPLIGDVTTGGLTKLAGGLVSAPMAPMPGAGASLLGTMGRTAAAGAGYGALYGAGEGDNAHDRMSNAALGAVVGGGVGLAAPAVSRGVANAVSTARDAVRPLPGRLAGMSRGAADKVLEDVNAARLFEPGPQNYDAQALRLGEQGMLADMGADLTSAAGGLATKPQVRATIATPIVERSAGSLARLERAVNMAVGRQMSVPDVIERLRANGRNSAAPLYNQFHSTPVKPSEALHGILDRARAAGAYDKARRAMQVDGFDPVETFYQGYPNSGVNNAGLNARFLDYVKRSVDDMAGAATRSGEREEARRFTTLARDLRTEVDRILSPNDPAQSIWARARQASGETLRLEDAHEAGQRAFSKSLSYDQMVHDMRRYTPAERMFYRLGARSQLHEVADAASTRFGPNGETAMMRTMGSRQADRKLRVLSTSPQAGANLSRVRDAEARFAATDQRLLGNSETASRKEQAKRWKLDANDDAMHNITLEGMVFGPAKSIVNSLLNGALSARRVREATDAARMLVARGGDRDAIVAGLRTYNATRGVSQAHRTAIQLIINRLVHGSRAPIIDARAVDLSTP